MVHQQGIGATNTYIVHAIYAKKYIYIHTHKKTKNPPCPRYLTPKVADSLCGTSEKASDLLKATITAVGAKHEQQGQGKGRGANTTSHVEGDVGAVVGELPCLEELHVDGGGGGNEGGGDQGDAQGTQHIRAVKGEEGKEGVGGQGYTGECVCCFWDNTMRSTYSKTERRLRV